MLSRCRLWLVLALVLGGPALVFAQSDYYSPVYAPRGITVQAEALMLQRLNFLHDQPVVQRVEGLQTSNLIGTGNARFEDLGYGPKLLLGYMDSCDTGIEAVYFGTQSWRSVHDAAGANNLRVPGALGLASIDYLDADRMETNYVSGVHNVEVNRVLIMDDWTLLGGFRWMNVNEHYNIHSVDLDSGASDYHVHATNNLMGGQLGIRVEKPLWVVDWEFEAKAGLFGNAAAQQTRIGDFNNTVVRRDAGANGGNFAFIGELDWYLSCDLAANWSIRGGYNLMFVQGLALAPDQLDFTNNAASSRNIDPTGGIFLHGVSAGLEHRW